MHIVFTVKYRAAQIDKNWKEELHKTPTCKSRKLANGIKLFQQHPIVKL
ncbi:MAG: hypothetical protein IPP48_08095 [Chitinophagaceae bacterium]|nr:hypothetical protein [Chitinophagaceae bacterium]